MRRDPIWRTVRDPGGRVIGYATDGAFVDRDPWGDGSWVLTVDGRGRWPMRTLRSAKARAEALLGAANREETR